jgi:hypothetical protein
MGKTVSQIALLLVLLVVAWWIYTTQLVHHPGAQVTQQAQSPIVTSAGQHDLRGAPSLTANQVDAILAQHGSPASGTGQIFYDESLATGINDIWPLGFYWHESAMGLAGVARFSKSIGNLRCINGADCVGGYAYFATWQQGIAAWYALMQNLYFPAPPRGFGATTVERIIPHYAPTADNNNESAYIASVVNIVQSWQ